MDDRERLILLNLIPDIGSLRLRTLLDHFGDLDRLWQASDEDLRQVSRIGPRLAQRLVEGRRHTRALEEELALARRHGLTLVTLQDAAYPNVLRAIHDPPVVLYVKGRLPAPEEATIALVGSRRASTYGVEVARRLAYDLALGGVTVISGLARGIDGAAHRGALEAHGRTIGVLGGGVCRFYPKEHDALASQMAEAGGAVISEYPMRMSPLAQNFPRRNRIISGLSQGVVVVEAAPRSGALITCDLALEQGRAVFAVPGQITAVTAGGTNRLLREGAIPVTCAQDILDELNLPFPARGSGLRAQQQVEGRGSKVEATLPSTFHLPPSTSSAPSPQPREALEHALAPAVSERGVRDGLTEHERVVLSQLDADEPADLEAIVGHAGLATAACTAALLTLELKRLVRQLPGKRFIRVGSSSPITRH
jgi:DNA processing protein